MPQHVHFDALPEELVARIEREVGRAYMIIGDEPERRATVSVRFTIERNENTGEVEGTYVISASQGDRSAQSAGKIRDGQLILPGTDVRSDDYQQPEPALRVG